MRPFLLTCSLLLCVLHSARADEGMWPFDQVPKAEIRAKLGVPVDDAWLDRVRLAAARVGFGCSGSFVSPDGLVLTNHHCAQDGIAKLSSSDRDLLSQGFLARTRAEELLLPSYSVEVLVGIEDITAKVQAATAGLDEEKANKTRKEVLTRLEKEAGDAAAQEASTGPLRVQAVELYGGGQRFLYKYKRFSDVRLVFAPELQIAAFGGDPDNFQFPRWCLDMTLLRAYENGQPAHTPNFLHMDFTGPQEGEPVFAAGNPGNTDRLLTVEQLKAQRDVELPLRILAASELRGRLIQFAKTGAEPKRIAQDNILSTENGLKRVRKQLDALHDESQLDIKRRAEQELRDRVARDKKLRQGTGQAWDDIARASAAGRLMFARRYFLENPRGNTGVLLRYARTLVRAGAELPKPNEQRLREFTESALPRVRQSLFAPAPVYPDLEKLMLSFWLERMREWVGPDDPFVKKLIGTESPDALAARLVDGTVLADPAQRKQLWEGGQAAVEASPDPMILFARTLEPESRALRARYESEVEAPVEAASERIARARFAVYGKTLSPDATGTLRLNYGRVQGWNENGVAVQPFTTIGTLFDRVTGEAPFALPAAWAAAKSKLDPSTPFDLCTNNDVVGGSSGSPLVDARGDLVGLIFDGNIHSISGTFYFDAEKNRTVALHPAAIREALDKVYGATALLQELGAKPAP